MPEAKGLPNNELETALNNLGKSLDYPEGDISLKVLRRIEAHPTGRRLPTRRLVVAIAVATAIAIFAAAMVVLPSARQAVADLLGLGGVGIRYGESPSAPPKQTPDLGLGKQVTIEQARSSASFRILTPTIEEAVHPDEIYFSDEPLGGQVAFVYRPRPELPITANPQLAVLITQFKGQLERESMGKVIGSGTRMEPVTINGSQGLWLEGEPHFFFYRDARGEVRQETIRLASNTLLWEVGGVTLRLESGLGKEDALRWAGSFR